MQPVSSEPRQLKNAVRAMLAAGLSKPVSVNRKQLLEAVRRAQRALELPSSERLVLAELAATHHHEREGEPIVFASNRWLEERCGCTERNIRLIISKLEDKGLVVRKASANGKRYQRKTADGGAQAFGISLAPVISRTTEFEQMIAARKRRAAEQADIHASISLARKSVKEAIEWMAHHPREERDEILARFETLMADTPMRRSKNDTPRSLLTQWETLKTDAVALLRDLNALRQPHQPENAKNPGPDTFSSDIISANAGNKFRHKENVESEISNEVCSQGVRAKPAQRSDGQFDPDALPPIFVAEACPAIREYGYPILTPVDLIASADQFRGLLGASRDTWDEGIRRLGAYGTALVVCYTLQRHEDDIATGHSTIENPGAYLRALVRKCATRDFDLLGALTKMRRRRLQ
ncbi:replication initiation protein [Camelimonas fluminis]|uniref:Plasmid replication protein RepC n=1 Tax=Camelimonas fluminis TaxID=1576911 RepID=A0ABV7UFK3_9HYPH|nr:plasmid replication protein RepC [Camelimonas fluminis]GHE72949.1 replication initiation protein [Camelimonas fluminis]